MKLGLAGRTGLGVAAAAVVLLYLLGVRPRVVLPTPLQMLSAKVRGKKKQAAKPVAVAADVAVDSALLPLTLHRVPVAGTGRIGPGAGGGLAKMGDRLIVADTRGAFAVWQDGRTPLELKLPPIPNGVEAYGQQMASQGRPLSPFFRVHDVEAAEAGGGVELYVAHEKFLTREATTALAVSRIRLDRASLEAKGEWENVYTGQPLRAAEYYGLGGGGRMVAEGGQLFLTVGDYGQDTVTIPSKPEAQNPENDFGKIIAIDLPTKRVSRLSSGHRNPQGLVRLSGGELFATEHGPKGGDELNRIIEGGNYGWPYQTFGTQYTMYRWPGAEEKDQDGMIPPVFAWVPSIGVSNLIEVRTGPQAWKGDLLVASLKARSLFRLHLDDRRRVVYSEPIWTGERVRDLVEMADGTIVAWTEDATLLTVKVDAAKLAAGTRVAALIDSPELQACWACHHTGTTTPDHSAPSLSRVFGRAIASDTFDRYSAGLKAAGGVWSEDNLVAFLTDPAAFAKGTAMSYRAGSAIEAAQIVKRLKALE